MSITVEFLLTFFPGEQFEATINRKRLAQVLSEFTGSGDGSSSWPFWPYGACHFRNFPEIWSLMHEVDFLWRSKRWCIRKFWSLYRRKKTWCWNIISHKILWKFCIILCNVFYSGGFYFWFSVLLLLEFVVNYSFIALSRYWVFEAISMRIIKITIMSQFM